MTEAPPAVEPPAPVRRVAEPDWLIEAVDALEGEERTWDAPPRSTVAKNELAAVELAQQVAAEEIGGEPGQYSLVGVTPVRLPST